MSIFSLSPAEIDAKIASTKEQLAVVKRQRAVLADRRERDPYDTRLPAALVQAAHRASALEQQIAVLEREAGWNKPAEARNEWRPAPSTVWVSSAHGDSRSGSNS
jgi:hypothetical protein